MENERRNKTNNARQSNPELFRIITMLLIIGHACLEYFLEHHPSADITDGQLEKLAPRNDDARRACGNNSRKGDVSVLLSSW